MSPAGSGWVYWRSQVRVNIPYKNREAEGMGKFCWLGMGVFEISRSSPYSL